MKSLILVLSLVIVLGYSQAEEPHGCNKTLGPEELHQVHGDWVMVWVTHHKMNSYDDQTPNITSCHTEIRVQDDNHTLVVHERYVYSGGKCISYTFNMTLPQRHEGHHRLDFVGVVETIDGESKPNTDTATAEFFPSSENTMKMLFKSKNYGSHLMMYRREGQHLDHLEEDHEEHRAMAKCLSLHGDSFVEWHYDGADFCHKKSVLPTLGSEALHQVDGDWVLVWMAYSKIKGQHDPMMNLTSSYMEIRVQTDNHTLDLRERNMKGGKCFSSKGTLILPQNSERIHRLTADGATQNIDGVEKPYNDTATIEFFPSSANTMEMLFKSDEFGSFLLMHRREGHHLDVKDLEKDHQEHKAKAKYLGLSGKGFIEWHYDGAAELCH